MEDEFELSAESRSRLDNIVLEMETNKESLTSIQFVVNDFKEKYGIKKKSENPIGEASNPSETSFQDGLDRSIPEIASESTSYSVNPEILAARFEKPITKKEDSFGKELYDASARGSARLGKQLASIPSNIYDIFALPQNIIADYFDLEGLSTNSDQFGEMIGVDNKVEEFYKDLSENYNQANEKFDQTITSQIEEGSYLDATQNLAVKVVENLPNTLAIMAMGGAGNQINTVAATTSLFYNDEDEAINSLKIPESEKTVAKLSKALTEGLTESMFTSGAGSFLVDIFKSGGKEAAESSTKNLFKEVYKKAGAAGTALGEGVEEATNQVMQNLIDINAGVEDRDVFEGVGDSFLIGMGSGGVIGGAVKTAEKITKSSTIEEEDIDTIREADVAKTKEEISKRVGEGEYSEQESIDIQNELQRTKDAIDKIDPDLPKPQQKKAVELIKERDAILEETSNLEVVSPKKQERLDQLNSEIESLNSPSEQQEVKEEQNTKFAGNPVIESEAIEVKDEELDKLEAEINEEKSSSEVKTENIELSEEKKISQSQDGAQQTLQKQDVETVNVEELSPKEKDQEIEQEFDGEIDQLSEEDQTEILKEYESEREIEEPTNRVEKEDIKEVEVKKEAPKARSDAREITKEDIFIQEKGVNKVAITDVVDAEIKSIELLDGSKGFAVSLYKDGELVSDKDGDTEVEFSDDEIEEIASYLNKKQKGYLLSKTPSKKKGEQPIEDIGGINEGDKVTFEVFGEEKEGIVSTNGRVKSNDGKLYTPSMVSNVSKLNPQGGNQVVENQKSEEKLKLKSNKTGKLTKSNIEKIKEQSEDQKIFRKINRNNVIPTYKRIKPIQDIGSLDEYLSYLSEVFKDASGEVMFHGTDSVFDSFLPEKQGSNTKNKDTEFGVFLSKNKDVSSLFIDSFKESNLDGNLMSVLINKGKEAESEETISEFFFGSKRKNKIIKEAKENGFDSITFYLHPRNKLIVTKKTKFRKKTKKEKQWLIESLDKAEKSFDLNLMSGQNDKLISRNSYENKGFVVGNLSFSKDISKNRDIRALIIDGGTVSLADNLLKGSGRRQATNISETIVFDVNRTHILGSSIDINGFKDFKNKRRKEKLVEQDFEEDIKILKALPKNKVKKANAINKRVQTAIKNKQISEEDGNIIFEKVNDIMANYDSVIRLTEEGIEYFSNNGAMSTIIPPFIIKRVLIGVREAYIAGKSLEVAIKEQLARLKKAGYNINKENQIYIKENILKYFKSVKEEVKASRAVGDIVEENLSAYEIETLKERNDLLDKGLEKLKSQKEALKASIRNRISNDRNARKLFRNHIKSLIKEFGIRDIKAIKTNKLLTLIDGTNRNNIENKLDLAYNILMGEKYVKDLNEAKKGAKLALKRFNNGDFSDYSGKIPLALTVSPKRLSVSDLSDYNSLLDKLKRGPFSILENIDQLDKFIELAKKHQEIPKPDPKPKTEAQIKSQQLREEVRAQEKDFAINKFLAKRKVKLPDLGQALEEEYRFMRDVNEQMLEPFSTEDINYLIESFEALERGVSPAKKYWEIKRDIKADIINKVFDETTKNKKFRKIFDDYISDRKLLTLSAKEIGKKKTEEEMFSRFIKSNPLRELDMSMKGLVDNSLFKTIIQEIAIGQDRMNSEYQILEDKINSLSNKIKGSTATKRKEQVKLSLIAIEQEHQNSPNNPEASQSISNYIESTKQLGEKNKDYQKTANEVIEVIEVYESMLDSQGQFDYQVEKSKLSKESKALLGYIEAYSASLAEKAAISAAREGQGVWLRNYYTPLSVQLPDFTQLEEITELSNQYSQDVSLKSGNLNKRTLGSKPLKFDFRENFLRATRGVLMQYHLREPLRTVSKGLNKIEASELDSTQKSFARAVGKALQEVGRNTFTNSLYDENNWLKAANILKKRGYQAALTSTLRSAVELGTNLGYASIYKPLEFIEGTSYITFSDPKIIERNKKFANLVGTTEFSRLFLKSTSIFQESGSFATKSATGAGKAIDSFNDALLSKADQAVALPIWMGSFTREFKSQTGKKFDMDKFVEDVEYRREFEKQVDIARDKADSNLSQAFSSRNPYAGIVNSQITKDGKGFLKAANRYMTSFRRFEVNSVHKAIQGVLGNNELSGAESTALFTATIVRMSAYQYLMKSMAGVFYSTIANLLDIDDGEDEDVDHMHEIKNSFLSTAVSLFIIGKLGNISSILMTYGIEEINKSYGEPLRDGEKYDQYKHGVTFNPVASEIMKGNITGKIRERNLIAPFAGPTGELTKQSFTTYESFIKWNNAKSKRQKEKYYRDLMYDLGILSTTTFITPVPRDVKNMLKRMKYKDAKWRNPKSKSR